MPVPLRGGALRHTALAFVALTATLSSTRGQTLPPPPDPLLVPENGVFARLLDHRSGQAVAILRSLRVAPRRTPDGHWVFSGSPTTLTIRSVGGMLRTLTVQDPYVDLCTTANSTILLATPTPTPRLVEVDVQANVIATWPLSLPPQLVEVDGAGRAWVAVDNPPQPLIQVIDASGAGGLLGLPGRLGTVTDIQTDARGHVFVCGSASNDVFEFDAALMQVATYAIGADPARGVTALEIGPDGRVHALQPETGIWRMDAARGAVDLVLDRAVRVFGFDPEGDLWTARGDRVFKLRDAGDRWIEEWSVDGLLGFEPVWEDIGGLGLAAVIAPRADSDGDGFVNEVEVRRGSSPFAAASTPAFDLDVKIGAPAGGTFEVRASGATAVGFVALSTARGPAVAVPGIGNSFDLDPAGLLVAPIPILVPGRLTIDVPSPLGASGVLWAQAAAFPLAGMPSFSDFGAARLERDGEARIIERFATAFARDPLASSRGWRTSGSSAGPAPLGGRGDLGSFDHTVGNEVEPGVFEFDTDDQLFPASVTLFGRPVRVTDGVFDFADFVVPAGVAVRFVGSRPAVIRARGVIRIDGELSVAGGDPQPDFVGASNGQGIARSGEPGARGGAGGGDGGSGGDASLGDGADPRFSGQDGDDAIPPAASGYFGTTGGTGGGGGLLFPATGLDSSLQFNLVLTLTSQLAGGGGGGGFLGAGMPGTVESIFTTVPSDRGPDSRAGAAVPFVPRPFGTSSLDHFLVGGAGGGGGGSHAFAMSRVNIRFERREWTAGAAGAGGGGALALRAGSEVGLSPGAVVSTRGGRGADLGSTLTTLPPSPGGGGSGGSLLIQVPDANALTQAGTLDLSGGRGSRIRFTSFTGTVGESVGGDGGHGQLRVEAPTLPSLSRLGVVNGPSIGPNTVGQLADRDAWSGVQSTFYRAETLLDPDWLGFEIVATIDGSRVNFDDSSTNRPNRPGSPLWFYVQGARLDAAGNPIEIGPWVESMAELDGQRADALRFLILFDTSVTQNVSVNQVILLHAR